MATMMNGYRFDMAKDGANEYAVEVNGKNVISGSNFASALDVFKYIDESIKNAGTSDVVHLVKEYDAKTKRHSDEVVRSNVRKPKKALA
ncbi:hypothetical protein CVD28_24950 [Bacillus sp. M6-12]|uniref:hypothetical protein n=1 Tax=Bacillus sp. M6-12 TaxID=2054166 RepID=UPI000C79041C|nr:hypothetical protein [Bacillus sp. M6-12]PLS15085.1 hypothetical protein CVD28_24950 [Bacillus sp. M6-12]